MSKKDYVAIALVIRNLHVEYHRMPQAQLLLRDLVKRLANQVFLPDNPAFDRERFFAASRVFENFHDGHHTCTLPPGTKRSVE